MTTDYTPCEGCGRPSTGFDEDDVPLCHECGTALERGAQAMIEAQDTADSRDAAAADRDNRDNVTLRRQVEALREAVQWAIHCERQIGPHDTTRGRNDGLIAKLEAALAEDGRHG